MYMKTIFASPIPMFPIYVYFTVTKSTITHYIIVSCNTLLFTLYCSAPSSLYPSQCPNISLHITNFVFFNLQFSLIIFSIFKWGCLKGLNFEPHGNPNSNSLLFHLDYKQSNVQGWWNCLMIKLSNFHILKRGFVEFNFFHVLLKMGGN